LDAYSEALTKIEPGGRIVRSGYFPLEPGWYLPYTCYWFGGDLWDETTHRFTLTDPKVVRAYSWIESYSRKFGKDSLTSFRSGFGNFDSPQNPFLAGTVLMEQQGPWMANYIDHLRPDLQRLLWSKPEEMTKPLNERKKNYAWAVAPFPAAEPGMENVTYGTFDVLVIPRGAKHKKEAFTFIAYLNCQEVMEKLCKLHCKNSPLAAVSDDFLNHHPNPYIGVFEQLANSPNARGVPQIPILPEVMDELNNVSQQLTLLETDAATALRDAQDRLQAKYDNFMEKQQARKAINR
jgi:multiple sugar transport system substrate-binding protein